MEQNVADNLSTKLVSKNPQKCSVPSLFMKLEVLLTLMVCIFFNIQGSKLLNASDVWQELVYII